LLSHLTPCLCNQLFHLKCLRSQPLHHLFQMCKDFVLAPPRPAIAGKSIGLNRHTLDWLRASAGLGIIEFHCAVMPGDESQ
jgi:hypothetical protein